MSQILTLEISDRVFVVIHQQAEALGVPPELLAATLLEQRFGQMLNELLSDIMSAYTP